MVSAMMGAAVADLVSELCRPGVLGAGAVELRTTHASWVFLCGDEVWKVKRPVDLGFLDFRTVEARRRFCEDELRLNRRLAPDVYLGIVPVRATADGLVVGSGEVGSGERAGGSAIVDWAVHMRRLPDEASAASLLAHGDLRRQDLAELAARLALFHREAADASDVGSTLPVNVEENFAQSERFVDDLLDRSTFDDARSFQRGWLAAHEGLLAARRRGGRLREGHGDLRLEHVYFLPDREGRRRPVVIDCVEFNERLRCGDVASDVGFLAMELEAERQPELAAGFVARYAEATDDFELYGVLDFYLSYRAWVRGKVAAMVARDPATSPFIGRKKELEARRDFALARSYAGRPSTRPFFICVAGLIGSGKSTLAAGLGRELAAPVVSSDRTRKALAGLAPLERGGPELYTPANREGAYAEVLRRAAVVARAGRGVVLDATFGERRWRAAAAASARAAGASFVLIELACADEAVLRGRLRARRGTASSSDATERELALVSRRTQAPDDREGLPILRVDGSGAQERTLTAALEGLRRLGGADLRRWPAQG